MNTHTPPTGPRNLAGKTPSGAHGKRLIKPASQMSMFQRLEAVAAWEPIWELVEQLEALPGANTGASPRREYRLMDIILMESAAQLEGSNIGAARLLGDRLIWRRLCRAARRAFPNDPNRRLSVTAPSRHQHYRARRDLLCGETLAAFKRGLRAQAVQVAKQAGLFDPASGSWSRPDATQCIVGDGTWIAAGHRAPVKKPATGDSDPGKVPGRELVVLSCRDTRRSERVLLDAEFVDRRIGTDGNDADQAVGMLQRLLAENGDSLRPGLRGLVYDTAMSPDAVDTVAGLGVLPIIKTPRPVTGGHRRVSLGSHAFTARDGTEHNLEVVTVGGSPVVVLTDSRDVETAVPLRRRNNRWTGGHDGRRVAHCRYALPDSPPVPDHLRDACTTIRLNSSNEGSHSDPHKRRTRALRPLPATDPSFAVFDARADVEAVFSNLRRHDHQAHNRLRGYDANDFRLLAYQILKLATVTR